MLNLNINICGNDYKVKCLYVVPVIPTTDGLVENRIPASVHISSIQDRGTELIDILNYKPLEFLNDVKKECHIEINKIIGGENE